MAPRVVLTYGLLAGFTLAACGCGGGEPVSRVSGEVLCDGQPVPAGMVAFEPIKTQSPPCSVPIRDGRYEVSAEVRLKPGAYLVRITAGDASQSSQAAALGPNDPVTFVSLLGPGWHVQSRMTVDLKPGKNVVDFRGKNDEQPKAEVNSP